MRTHGFKIDNVSPRLLKDLIGKSQGNPMVIKLLCKYLSGSPAVVTRDKVLQHIYVSTEEHDQFSLPMDASAAVISSLDKMSSNTQMVLRVASVAGQFFSMTELQFCLKALNFEQSSSEEIFALLQAAQEHGLLSTISSKNDGVQSDFSFHHYLIYQGIYGSILQKRKEELHQLYSEYYEICYNATFSKPLVQPLLYHLLKLPEQEPRKAKFVKIAFQTFADWNRPVEAQLYYDMLKELEAMGLGSARKTYLEMAQEARYLALMYSDFGNLSYAEELYYRGFALLGLDMKKSKLKVIWNILFCANVVSKMIKADERSRNVMALQALCQTFKNVFRKKDIDAYIATTGGKIHPIPSDAEKNYLKIFEVVEEIRLLCNCTIGLLMATEPGLELGLMQFLFYFSQLCWPDCSHGTVAATANTSTALVLLAMGKTSQAKTLIEEAFLIYREIEDVEISRKGLSIYWSYSALFFSLGDFETSIPAFRTFLDTIYKAFSANPEVMHFIRMQLFVAESLLGNTNNLIAEIEENINGLYSDEKLLLCDLNLFLAHNFISKGRFEEALQLYNQSAFSIKTEKKPTAFRVLICMIFKTSLEVTLLLTPSLHTDAVGDEITLAKNLIQSSEMIGDGVKRLGPPQPYLFPLLLLFLPTWLDFIYLKHSRRLFLRNQDKSFKSLCNSVCAVPEKGSKAFPICHKFTKHIKSHLHDLQKKPTKSRIFKLIQTAKCTDNETAPDGCKFLTDHWRSRMLAKIAKISFLLHKKDRDEILSQIGDKLNRRLLRLEPGGLDFDAALKDVERSTLKNATT
ncbi:hypothetical protein HDU97_008985 [Phlyctochytrium planicorne]|nr:hypothetical protein HDU97_008985 [Phlyctochytrium planicorne]